MSICNIAYDMLLSITIIILNINHLICVNLGTSSLPGTPTNEKEDSPATARKTLSSDSPRLKKLIRVKSMGSPMDSPIINRKDKNDQLVLGEYSLKSSTSEPVLANPGSEGGSLSDDDSSAEGKLRFSRALKRICEFMCYRSDKLALYVYLAT